MTNQPKSYLCRLTRYFCDRRTRTRMSPNTNSTKPWIISNMYFIIKWQHVLKGSCYAKFPVHTLFGGPHRTGLHTVIFKNHISFLIWCTAVASHFTLYREQSIVATEWDIWPLFNLWWELHMCITWVDAANQGQNRAGHARKGSVI